MKRLLNCMIAVAALAGWSCAGDMNTSVQPAQDRKLTFGVDFDDRTRIVLEDNKYCWEGGEALGVFVASQTPTLNVPAEVEVRDGFGWCSTATRGFADGDMLYGYYPYSRDNAGRDMTSVELEIPDLQIQSEAGRFNVENMPMVAEPVVLTTVSEQARMNLRALGGFLRFNIYASGDYAGEKVQTITFVSDTPMAGVFEYDLTAVGGTLPAIAGHSATEVSVDLGTEYEVGSTREGAEGIYMVLAPAQYDGLLEVKTDKAGYTYDYKRTVERNKYYNVNIDLSKAADRTPVEPEKPEPQPITATLTYDEASDKATGYGKENLYTNAYGEWTICAYNYDKSSFQLNGGKVAYISTPQFEGEITEIKINTVENFTGNMLICTDKGEGSMVVSQKGGGSSTRVDLTGKSLSKVYIRANAVCRISDITVVGNGKTSQEGLTEPKFAEVHADASGASSATAADGSAILAATIVFDDAKVSLTNSGFAWKSAGATEFTRIDCGAAAEPITEIKGLKTGLYDWFVYAVMSDGKSYESEHATFSVRDLSVKSDYKYGWFELPVQTDVDNNGIDDVNPDYYYSHTFRADAPKIRNFSSCYSKSKIHPIWVAAPMHKCYLGSSGRNDSYRADPNIKCAQSSKFTGYTRGHMIGSSDRTVSVATNKQAFYYSNIGAQMSNGFNTGGGAWNNLEDRVDGYLCADTLYQVIGVVFQTWTDKYGKTTSAQTGSNSVGKFQVPTGWYKVLLRTKKGNTGKRVDECSRDELQCVAFMLGHYPNKSHKPSTSDMYPVTEIEKMTGLTFFPNVPNAPKDEFKASDWGF